MTKRPSVPEFASVGRKADSIDVRLSYRIIELFSEGLYASATKAVEELVANSFDAGALSVHVLLSEDLNKQDASIVVIDDGEGMGIDGLKQHWLIGVSNKRALSVLPRGRQQIGKFGIGKLATYVLAQRLTHITKVAGKYFSTSMDFGSIERRVDGEVEPRKPISIPLRELTESQARKVLLPWLGSRAHKGTGIPLFGRGSRKSWTVAVLSDLKPKVHEIKPGILEWVLRTALPLRPDFSIWLNGKRLEPSKQGKGLLKRWVLGKDLKSLPRPAPKGIAVSIDKSRESTDEKRQGLLVPGLGRITGYAEAYKDLLTGKSDELGRSYGFFVYVFGRLVNVVDGHFGISPNELRHGSFGRFRVVVDMDGLDTGLRSNREAIGEGSELATAQDVLRAIFNAVRPTLELYDRGESPGAKLARKVASTPSSLSRAPLLELAREVVNGRLESKYLLVPKLTKPEDRERFLKGLEERSESADQFVSSVSINFDGSVLDGIARYDTETGVLRINAWHPLVATFHDEFASKGAGQPLELFALAEVLAEAQLHAAGVQPSRITEFLVDRDQLLRTLATETGRQSALSVANNLINSRNNRDELEKALCSAFASLGFEVTPLGKKGKPDGVATAYLPPDDKGVVQRYSVSLEAKSKEKDETKVSAKTVGVSGITRQRDEFDCDHALVVAPAFATSGGDKSALAKEIDDDRTKSKANGKARTVTLIDLDDLARLVRLRPLRQLSLRQLRSLFLDCRLPSESKEWVDKVRKSKVSKPPYKKIIATIASQQKKFAQAKVKYAALRVALSVLEPPIDYSKDEELLEVCRAMAQMAPGSIFASSEAVELEQSAENAIAAIEKATDDYPPNER